MSFSELDLDGSEDPTLLPSPEISQKAVCRNSRSVRPSFIVKSAEGRGIDELAETCPDELAAIIGGGLLALASGSEARLMN
jgi:hypothetical protein